MKQQVFVSYSHKDYDARDQLQRFLRPLERDGLIDDWVDTRLEGGDEWRAEIERALAESTVAVVFISQDFIASEFIFTQELPYILAAVHAGKLTVIPVFLSPSSVKSTDFSFTDPSSGEQATVNLTRYQGYGTPEHPLSEMSWSDRERQYTQLAERIRALMGTQTRLAATPQMSATISSALPENRTYALG
jgi:TIR domain